MATLESQQAKLDQMLLEGMAHAVRLIESQGSTSKIVRALGVVLRDIRDPSSTLVDDVIQQRTVGGAEPTVSEAWLVESLRDARNAIAKIQPQRVRDTRRANQSTDAVFESFIQAARKMLTASPRGVDACIADCFKNQSKYPPIGVKELADLSELSASIKSRLDILSSRTLSALFSGWVLAVALALAILSVPIVYFGKVYLEANQPTLAQAAPLVVSKLDRDLATVSARANEPGKTSFERLVSYVEGIWKLIDTLPKILGAIAVGWGLLRAWLRR